MRGSVCRRLDQGLEAEHLSLCLISPVHSERENTTRCDARRMLTAEHSNRTHSMNHSFFDCNSRCQPECSLSSGVIVTWTFLRSFRRNVKRSSLEKAKSATFDWSCKIRHVRDFWTSNLPHFAFTAKQSLGESSAPSEFSCATKEDIQKLPMTLHDSQMFRVNVRLVWDVTRNSNRTTWIHHSTAKNKHYIGLYDKYVKVQE